jgi:hypothetical protein
MEKPVIEDRIQSGYFGPVSIGILSLTPERRTVLYNFKTRRFCAENPTEVGIDLASAQKFVAGLDLATKGSAELGIALAAASSNQVLNRRTQGMQLFQASSFTFCQMYLNGAISEEKFLETQLLLLSTAATLIEKELDATVRTSTATMSTPVASALSPTEGVTSMITKIDKTVTLKSPAAQAASPPAAAK